MFVGRRTELAVLREELARAAAGTPRIVVVTGEAGYGKSALLRHFASGIDAAVARASGEEAEALYPFGVVDQLSGELRRHVNGAGTSSQDGPRDPLEVGAELLDLLGMVQAAAGSRPVMLVIDDAQWFDTPSLHALAFAVRRLHADRILVVVAHRGEEDGRLDPLRRLVQDRGRYVRLGGLSVTEISELSHAAVGEALPRAVARRLHAHTEGHPLTALALLEELPPSALRAAPDPLPAPRSHALVVLRRLAGCSPAAEQLVVAAAVLGVRCDLGLAARLADIDDPGPVVTEAADARLVDLVDEGSGRVVAFAHQLVRAAIYHDLNPGKRLALHARAARLSQGAAALEHRAAAVATYDREVAAALTDQAATEVAAGAASVGASHLLTAARCHPDPEARRQLLLEGVSLLLHAGEVAEARTWEQALIDLPVTAGQRVLLGQLAALGGHQARALELLTETIDRAEKEPDERVSAMAAIQLGQLSLLQARASKAVEWGQRATTYATGNRQLEDAAIALVTLALGMSGHAPHGLDLVGSLGEEARQLPESALERLLARGIVRVWSDDLAGGTVDLRAVNESGGHQRPLRLRLTALGCLSKAEFRRGAWDDSLAHSNLAASLAEDADHEWAGAFLSAMASLVPACRGAWEDAAAHVEASWAAAQRLDTDSDRAYAAWARANLAFARADPAGVVAAIEPVLAVRHRDGFGEPGVTPWRELHIDALISLGRLDDAAVELSRFESLARRRGRRTSLAAACMERGRLHAARGEDGAARVAFEDGLGHVEGLGTPFSQALLEYAYGCHLRRVGRRRDAEGKLEAARKAFDTLAALPFLERCERELAACGRSPARRSDLRRTQLTPQELAVARLVAEGCTNREVAAELVVSVKTVEYHLGNIFTKLGLRSRSQLAARLAVQPSFAR